MSKSSKKIVRPWPADQPRPPLVCRVGCVTRTMHPAKAPRKTSRQAD